MKFFKKKEPKDKYLIEPEIYPNTYELRKWDTYMNRYSYMRSYNVKSKEELEGIIAFYSQPTVYF